MDDPQIRAVALALLDALTALDPEDHVGSARAVPLALQGLDLVPSGTDERAPVVYGALALCHTAVGLIAQNQGVDRLDVIAALRQLFDVAPEPPGAPPVV